MDELTMLREGRPDVPPVTATVLDAGRARLVAASRPRRRALPRRAVRPLALGSLAATIAVVITVGLTVAQSLTPGRTPEAAAAVLRQAATAALHDPDPGPGQYRYTLEVARLSITHAQSDWSRVHCTETWSSVDGSRPGEFAVRRRIWQPAQGTDKCGTYEARDRGVVLRSLTGRPDEAGGRDYPEVRSLPADQRALRARLYQEAGQGAPHWSLPPGTSQDQIVFTIVGRLLAVPVPAKLRAVLYETMGTIPGVELIRDTRDGLGRRGVAVIRTSGDTQEGIILDPDTHRYLGSRSEPAANVNRPGVVEVTALMKTTIVNVPAERP